MNTPREPSSLALADSEKRIVESIRIARDSATLTQWNRYTMNLAADMISKLGQGKNTAVRQILALLRDAFDRGASEGDLLAVADQLRSEISSWYDLQRGMLPADLAELRQELADAHLAEETTEAEKDIAETILAHHTSAGAAQRFLRTTSAHEVADGRFKRCARHIMQMVAQ